jgi:hypothetical protein
LHLAAGCKLGFDFITPTDDLVVGGEFGNPEAPEEVPDVAKILACATDSLPFARLSSSGFHADPDGRRAEDAEPRSSVDSEPPALGREGEGDARRFTAAR